ncbi:hypothetical protein M433DRAFT_155020 [Acidomyces richmondensis BFW]|nr:hypothetical protein M433DRAFT_161229 [Acidomyces richmondensis BFW]KYG44966.1 hypothetical protein M433DRAFT_155020 [Acidomyces richmondensis BFW]
MDTVEHGTATTTGRTILQLPGGIAVREYRHSDVRSIARHANNRNVWNNLRNRMPHPYSEADAEWWINHTMDSSNHVRSGNWSLEKGSQGPAIPSNYTIAIDDEAVGGIGLDFKDDIYIRTAEIGYWLGEEQWGKGIMSRVVPAFTEWAWQTFEILVRINAETFERNVASQKLLEKAGFRFEGRRPNMVFKNGIIESELIWGALRPS